MLKVDEPEDTKSALVTSRDYQDMAVGYRNFSIEIASNFVESLSCLFETLKTLHLSNVHISRELFGKLVCDFKNLEVLRLDSVECFDKMTRHQNDILTPPHLKSLILQNYTCESSIKELWVMRIQSRHVECLCDGDTIHLPKLLSLQINLESLIISNVYLLSNVDCLLQKLIDCNVFFSELKKLAIFWMKDSVDIESDRFDSTIYDDEADQSRSPVSMFLSTHACILRELHMDKVNYETLETIANDMQLTALSLGKVVGLSTSDSITDMRSNLHLKKLFLGCTDEDSLSMLSKLFPSVETLKVSFRCHENTSIYPIEILIMLGRLDEISISAAIGKFKLLKNLRLTLTSEEENGGIMEPFHIDSLRIIQFDFENFPQMRQFLESNCNSIEVLVIENFTMFSHFTPADEILNFMSNFRRIVLTLTADSDCNFHCLEGFSENRFAGAIEIEVRSNVFERAQKDLDKNSPILRLLTKKSENYIDELTKMFEMEKTRKLNKY